MLFETMIAARMEDTALLHEQLASPISQASEHMTASLSAGGKLYFAATPVLRGIASQLVENLMSLKLVDQPALPALLLPWNQNGDADSANPYENLCMQLEAVATPQDCIVILDEDFSGNLWRQLRQFFKDTQCYGVGILHSANPEHLGLEAIPQFCSLSISSQSTAMPSIAIKQEQTLFILNCLTAMIEQAMFGEHRFGD